MQYTLRNIPKGVDRALRDKARREGKSLNEVAIAALGEAVGVGAGRVVRRDLADIAGSWIEDAAVERALDEQDVVDPEMWR